MSCLLFPAYSCSNIITTNNTTVLIFVSKLSACILLTTFESDHMQTWIDGNVVVLPNINEN